MFGEVYSADTSVTSHYVREGRLDATLDFPFQDAARNFASQGGSAQRLARLFADDYKYTTGKANAYESVTFLGNHDMGRFGTFLKQDNAKAGDAELLKRYGLANELMFLSRGNTVVYYGDEQGFTGAGGGRTPARPCSPPRPRTTWTTTSSAPDAATTGTPTTRRTRSTGRSPRSPHSARTTRRSPTASRSSGTPTTARACTPSPASTPGPRPSTSPPSTNATEARTVELATDTPAGTAFRPVYGEATAATSGADGKVTVTVPALSSVVLKAGRAVAAPASAPSVALKAPAAGASGTVEVTADVTGGGPLNRVVFAAQQGSGRWQVLGSADRAPYRVSHTITAPAGATVRYKAVAVDARGRTASDLAQTTAGQAPAPEVPTATQRDHAVVHCKRPDGDYDGWRLYAWGDIAEGEATPWPEGHAFTGRDAYGAFAHVKLKPGASSVGYLVIDENGNKDVAADRTIDLSKTGEVWVEQARSRPSTRRPTAPTRRRTPARPSCTTSAPTATTTAGACTCGPAPPSHRLVQAAHAGPHRPVRRGLRGAARRGRHVPQLHHPQGRREGPARRPVPGPEGDRPRGVAARRPGEAPAAAARGRRRGPGPHAVRGRLDRRDHPRLERLGRRRVQPAPVLPVRLPRRQGRRADRRLRHRLAAAAPHEPHRRAEGAVPAPRAVHRVLDRPARPRPRPHRPARPGRRHPARRQRRPAERHRRPDRRRPRRPVRREKAKTRALGPVFSQGPAHPLSVWAPHRPVRRPRTRRPHRPHEAGRRHRRLVRQGRQVVEGQAPTGTW